jgi:cytochrome P450 family 6
LYVYFIRNFNFWKKLGIPYVKPVPFVGNIKELVFLKLGIGHYLQKIYEEHKDMSYVGILSFRQPSLLIRDLDLVKKIVVKDAYKFMDRVVSIDDTVEPVGGKTVFNEGTTLAKYYGKSNSGVHIGLHEKDVLAGGQLREGTGSIAGQGHS